jgi:hypothetical protein
VRGDLEKWKIDRALADTIDTNPAAVPTQTSTLPPGSSRKINELIGP